MARWERIGPDVIARLLVALPCSHQLALRDHLRDWDLRVATPEGELEAWDGRRLELPLHGIWARRPGADDASWTCEFLLQEEHDGRWAFRRNPAMTAPLGEIGRQRGQVRFLRPGVVLLFKARRPTPKDEQDFETVLPELPASERRWLIAALDVAHPGHPWRGRLGRD